MSFKPGPGLGGHCIPVDPQYLAWKLRALNFTARFVELADAVNSAMPEHVVSVMSDALNDLRLPLRGSKILVLGVAYKPDVADVRESPALHVIALLRQKGAVVAYNDPYIPSLDAGDVRLESVPLTDEALAKADAVLIVTDHGCYDALRIARLARLIVDTRNATAPAVEAEPSLRDKIRRI
jgi:UDP-N-acetyl-D-glucosamine dehydrogenase